MNQGYLLADANSLAYAHRTGGTKLLDIYYDLASKEHRLGMALAQDRERFKNEPAPGRQQPSVERTQERVQEQAPRRLLEEAPVQKQAEARQAAPPAPAMQAPAPTRGTHAVAPVAQAHVNPARPAAAAEAMHSPTIPVSTHASVAAPVHSSTQGAAAAIAAAQARAAAAQAELAEVRQQLARMAAERGYDGLERRDERDPRSATAATAVAGTSRPLLRDFSDPGHPQHALYNTLKAGLPERTDPAWLSHVTAACYKIGIKQPDDLGDVVGREGKLHIRASSLVSRITTVDVTQPAPSVQQTMQDVQQFDQQRAIDRAQAQAQAAAQANQQQGPVMG